MPSLALPAVSALRRSCGVHLAVVALRFACPTFPGRRGTPSGPEGPQHHENQGLLLDQFRETAPGNRSTLGTKLVHRTAPPATTLAPLVDSNQPPFQGAYGWGMVLLIAR